jgi:hypothetical protein
MVHDSLDRLTEIWNDLPFEDVQHVFREWQIRINWVIENGGEYSFKWSQKNGNLLNKHSQGILSAGLFGHSVASFWPSPYIWPSVPSSACADQLDMGAFHPQKLGQMVSHNHGVNVQGLRNLFVERRGSFLSSFSSHSSSPSSGALPDGVISERFFSPNFTSLIQ